MISFLLRRLAWSFLVVWLVVTVVFVLMFAAGDACAAKLGANATPVKIAECRAYYGFDQPIADQYLSFMGAGSCVRRNSDAYHTDPARRGRCGLLQADLGKSMGFEEDVLSVIATRLPRTLLLGAMAMSFELILGVLVGIIAATRRNTWIDTGTMGLAFLGISAPTFLTGVLFLYFFAFRLGWFPVGGFGVDFWDHVGHALLPAFTLAIIGAATYARIMRSEMIDQLRSEYVRTAKAKGLGPVQVVMHHAARNALLPIVTLMGLQLSILVSGAIITEEIYAWPGVGRLSIEAIRNLDAPMVTGTVLIVSATVQLGNFLADVLVATLDPRIRMS